MSSLSVLCCADPLDVDSSGGDEAGRFSGCPSAGFAAGSSIFLASFFTAGHVVFSFDMSGIVPDLRILLAGVWRTGSPGTVVAWLSASTPCPDQEDLKDSDQSQIAVVVVIGIY